VAATIGNAQATLDVQREFGSLDAYLWGLAGGAPVRNRFAGLSDIPAETPVAKAMSKELKKRGFRFVGPTICYAFMQATGMVNDHITGCFRWREIG
jgi:DNA-3-methyladenine glycosylase I